MVVSCTELLKRVLMCCEFQKHRAPVCVGAPSRTLVPLSGKVKTNTKLERSRSVCTEWGKNQKSREWA